MRERTDHHDNAPPPCPCSDVLTTNRFALIRGLRARRRERKRTEQDRRRGERESWSRNTMLWYVAFFIYTLICGLRERERERERGKKKKIEDRRERPLKQKYNFKTKTLALVRKVCRHSLLFAKYYGSIWWEWLRVSEEWVFFSF